MKMFKIASIAGVAALTAACATPFTADVSRFQRLPAPTGQTYAIVAMGDETTDSLEFQTYSRYVAGQMNAQGFEEVASPDAATLIVSLDYGVGDGRERVRTRPGFGGFYGRGFYGRGFYGGGFYRPIFYDPFFYGPGFGAYGGGFGGGEVYSYTVYNSYLDMNITRQADGIPVFEGRAESTTRGDDLPRLVPQLVTAMFTDFPGQSGKTIRVKVKPEEG
ncbi:MAG: DUF4136 domain-containing protein [Pacificimonas sp.]